MDTSLTHQQNSLTQINLHDHITELKASASWQDSDRATVILYKSESMRVVLLGLHKDAALKPHKASGVISVQVLEGKMEFATEAESAVLQKGQMITLEQNIMHSVLAHEETFFLLTLALKN